MVRDVSKMIGRLARVMVLGTALGLALVTTSGVSSAEEAASPASIGTLTCLSTTVNSVKVVHGDTIIDKDTTLVYTGGLVGTSHGHGVLIFHHDGTANFHDLEVFTGTVNGVPGTVTFDLQGSSDPDLVVTASDTILSATGQLAGLHGVLHESAVVLDKAIGPVGIYHGHLHIDPK